MVTEGFDEGAGGFFVRMALLAHPFRNQLHFRICLLDGRTVIEPAHRRKESNVREQLLRFEREREPYVSCLTIKDSPARQYSDDCVAFAVQQYRIAKDIGIS